MAVDQYFAAGRVNDAADDVDQGCLACSVRAKEGKNLTFVDRQVDVLQGLKPAGVGLGEALYVDHGLHVAMIRRKCCG